MSELKLCPFCGKNTGYIKKIVISIDWIIYTPYCENLLCEASLGANNRTYDTLEEAEAAWNTRPLEDALQARIAALESALREIRDLIPVTHYELYEMANRALKGEVKE